MKEVWWLENDPYIDRFYNRYKHRENSSFFRVKHCEGCKNSWETVYSLGGRNIEIKYYPDFPTYGLERVECPKCEGE